MPQYQQVSGGACSLTLYMEETPGKVAAGASGVRLAFASEDFRRGSSKKQRSVIRDARGSGKPYAGMANLSGSLESASYAPQLGYIIRALAKGNQNTLLVRQITNALVADGLIYSPDISKHIEYLEEAGYIVFTSRTANAYNAYRKDAVIKLTRKGVDLLESTIDDPGVDV